MSPKRTFTVMGLHGKVCACVKMAGDLGQYDSYLMNLNSFP